MKDSIEHLEEYKPKKKDDGLYDLIQQVSRQQKDLADRLDAMEKKKQPTGEAALRLVNLTYNTDDEHLPELTRVPIQAVRPHALGMMLESIFDDDIQSGEVPLSRKLRNYYFRLMRSVHGEHLARGTQIAENQIQNESEAEEELDLGGD